MVIIRLLHFVFHSALSPAPNKLTFFAESQNLRFSLVSLPLLLLLRRPLEIGPKAEKEKKMVLIIITSISRLRDPFDWSHTERRIPSMCHATIIELSNSLRPDRRAPAIAAFLLLRLHLIAFCFPIIGFYFWLPFFFFFSKNLIISIIDYFWVLRIRNGSFEADNRSGNHAA